MDAALEVDPCALAVEQTGCKAGAVGWMHALPLPESRVDSESIVDDLFVIPPVSVTSGAALADLVAEVADAGDEAEEAVEDAEEGASLGLDHELGEFEVFHEIDAALVEGVDEAGDGAGVVVVDEELKNKLAQLFVGQGLFLPR